MRNSSERSANRTLAKESLPICRSQIFSMVMYSKKKKIIKTSRPVNWGAPTRCNSQVRQTSTWYSNRDLYRISWIPYRVFVRPTKRIGLLRFCYWLTSRIFKVRVFFRDIEWSKVLKIVLISSRFSCGKLYLMDTRVLGCELGKWYVHAAIWLTVVPIGYHHVNHSCPSTCSTIVEDCWCNWFFFISKDLQ